MLPLGSSMGSKEEDMGESGEHGEIVVYDHTQCAYSTSLVRTLNLAVFLLQ